MSSGVMETVTSLTPKPFVCEKGKVHYDLQWGTENPGDIFTLTPTFEDTSLPRRYPGSRMCLSQLGENTACFKQTPVTLTRILLRKFFRLEKAHQCNKHSCWYKRIRVELRASSASSLSWPGSFLGELTLVIMRKWTTYKVNRFLNTCNITSSGVWIINSVISFNRLHTPSSSVWPSSVHVCPWKSRVWMRQ